MNSFIVYLLIPIAITFILMLMYFFIKTIDNIFKKKNNKNDDYTKPKEGYIYWSDNWTISGIKKRKKRKNSNNRMFIVRKIKFLRNVHISPISSKHLSKKRNYRLTKEKYDKLPKESCVVNQESSKIIVSEEPKNGKRGKFKDLKKKTLTTNNKEVFKEFYFSVDDFDKKELRKKYKTTPNREKEEGKQKKFKQKKLNKKRGQS